MRRVALLIFLYLVHLLVDCGKVCEYNKLYLRKSDDEIPINELSASEDNQVVFRWSMVNTNKDIKMSLSWNQPLGSHLRWAAVAFCPKIGFEPCKPHTNCDIVAVWFDNNGNSQVQDMWGTGPKSVIEDPEDSEDYTVLSMAKLDGPTATIEFKRKLYLDGEYDSPLNDNVYVGVAGGVLGTANNPLLAKPHDYTAMSKTWINFSKSSGKSNTFMTFYQTFHFFTSYVFYCLLVGVYYY